MILSGKKLLLPYGSSQGFFGVNGDVWRRIKAIYSSITKVVFTLLSLPKRSSYEDLALTKKVYHSLYGKRRELSCPFKWLRQFRGKETLKMLTDLFFATTSFEINFLFLWEGENKIPREKLKLLWIWIKLLTRDSW